MDFSQRLRDRLPQIFRAFHAVFSGCFRFAFVEGLFGDGVREPCDRASVVDLGLRALGFQLVQNRRELGHLLIAKVELVRQKTQRSTNAEPSATTVVAAIAATEAA